ncbi:DNA directed RNA polymerase [Caudoviricetes sp.]|nr:DNA directed RNA polymerase [Caudoviricetes sp.]
MLKALDKIEHGITDWIAMVAAKRGTRPVALQWLTQLEPDVLAYLTVKVLLDGMQQPRSLYALALQIAGCVEDELVYRKLRAEKPALFQYLTTAKFLTQHYDYNARMLRGAVRANVIDVSTLRMTKAEKIHVGSKLIDLCITTTGLFRAELTTLATKGPRRKNAKRDQWQVLAEPETVKWVQAKNELLQWLTPMAMPMVVPPIPWSREGALGGYRYGLRERFDLVRGISDEQQAVVRKGIAPMVYTALNAIQSTAWRINTRILEVVEAIAERGGGLAGVPILEPEPLPAKPVDIAENREARKAWRAAAHATITANTIRTQEALKWRRVMREAELLRDEETLFFPHNLDFRGRIYPIATHLSPQGDDLCKGLLTFVEGKPLGWSGMEALAIHGANCMDTCPETGIKLGQRSLEERIAWVFGNYPHILKSARDPLAYMWWTQAEEPLQFLAFCFEWARARERSDSENYVCALPIAIDGSCNGLQHFSAMFRDEIGGAAVNLLPSNKPQDVYQRVCDTVTESLRAVPDGHEDFLLARRWLSSGLLTRKLTKRPTMTFGYGSKVFGFQDQIIEYLSADLRPQWGEIKAHFTIEGSAQVIQAARLLSRHIWSALQQNVVKAFEGMEWLQKCAQQVVRKSSQGVRWTVPVTGFPVMQEYYHQEKRAISTILAGKVIKPRLYVSTGKPLALKQMNGVSPNVVHSLDAAALLMTVDRCVAAGLTSFAAIHDSYGTVPGDMATLARLTREAFCTLYAHPVAADLHQQFQAQAPSAVLPSPPSPGGLDLAEVRSSLYFFA